MSESDVTPAHDQSLTLHLIAHVPEHSPREDDPHYHLGHPQHFSRRRAAAAAWLR